MKRTIVFMFIYAALYISVMSFVQKHYNYDWTPVTPRENHSETIENVLIKEGSPTPMTDKLQSPAFNDNNVQPEQKTETQNSSSVAEKEILSAQNQEQTEENNTQEIQQKETEQQILSENPTTEVALPEQTEEIVKETNQEIVKEQPLEQETAQGQNPPAEQTIEKKGPTLQEQLDAANLVDIRTLRTKVFLRIKYATTNNFTERKLYNKAKCYLKKPAAQALVKAAKMAVEEEFPFWLCIYDCYRPSSVQKIMLKSVKEQGFLSKVSNHSRGMAVDVGPCNMQGEPLLTPTAFDTFSDVSGAYYYGDEVPEIAIQNRTALQEVMKKAGFNTISNEWWHFDYKGAKNEPVLDIKF